MALSDDVQELCSDWNAGGSSSGISSGDLHAVMSQYTERALQPGAPRGLLVYSSLDDNGTYTVGYKVNDA